MIGRKDWWEFALLCLSFERAESQRIAGIADWLKRLMSTEPRSQSCYQTDIYTGKIVVASKGQIVGPRLLNGVPKHGN